MQTVLQALDIFLPVMFALVFGLYAMAFAREDDQRQARNRHALYVAIAFHTVYFVLRGAVLGYFPLGTKAEFLSWVAYSLAAVYALIERQMKQSKTGAFFVLIVFALQLIASITMTYSEKHAVLLENPIYGLHVSFMVFGVAGMATGALYAVMYGIMFRQLTARELGVFFKRLPPLAILERMSKTATFAGWVLLGIGLVVGHLVGLTVPDVNQLDLKFIVSDLIWISYGVAIGLIRTRGLAGLTTAYLTVFGFFVLLISAGLGHSFQ